MDTCTKVCLQADIVNVETQIIDMIRFFLYSLLLLLQFCTVLVRYVFICVWGIMWDGRYTYFLNFLAD